MNRGVLNGAGWLRLLLPRMIRLALVLSVRSSSSSIDIQAPNLPLVPIKLPPPPYSSPPFINMHTRAPRLTRPVFDSKVEVSKIPHLGLCSSCHYTSRALGLLPRATAQGISPACLFPVFCLSIKMLMTVFPSLCLELQELLSSLYVKTGKESVTGTERIQLHEQLHSGVL